MLFKASAPVFPGARSRTYLADTIYTQDHKKIPSVAEGM